MTDDQTPIIEQPPESITWRPCWSCEKENRAEIVMPSGESFVSIYCEYCGKAAPIIQKVYGAAPRVEWGEMTL